MAGALAVSLFLASAPAAHAGSAAPIKSLGKAGPYKYLTATFPDVASLAGAPVDCGSRFAVGGGATIAGTNGASELYTTSPFVPLNVDSSADGWAGQAFSSGGERERTYAVCGKKPVPFASMGASVPGSPAPAAITVACPSGHVLSGGFYNDASNRVDLVQSGPVDGPDLDLLSNDAWTFQVINLNVGTSNPTVSVACSPDAKTFNGEGIKNVSDGTVGKIVAKCPRKYVLTGTGFSTDDASGLLVGLTPWDSKDKDKTPENGSQLRIYNNGGTVAAFTATSVCARI